MPSLSPRRPILSALVLASVTATASAQVKISQVYGGGGNTNAQYLSDYIEILNTGAPQDLTGWSVQYASSTGTTWTVHALPSVVLGTGRYFLIKEADGTTNPATQSLALAPDHVGAPTPIAMSATDFKLALVSSTTALVGGTPTYSGSPTLVDFVGCGAANWNDASASGVTHTTANNAPAPSNNNAIFRRVCGAQDTSVSYADWGVGLPLPRNTATPANNGLTGAGMVHPFFAKEGQVVRIAIVPANCSGAPLAITTTVTANLTPILGSATQPLFDDGTNGDQVAGDGIFTYAATVGIGTPTGTRTIQITIDDGSLSGGTAVGLEVRVNTTPDNDNCAHAAALAVPSTTAVNFTGATIEYNVIPSFSSPFTGGHSTRRGLWYTVIGTGNTITASTCSNTLDTVLMAAVGSCDGLTVIAGRDDAGPACAGAPASVSFCTVLGETYYIWLGPFSTGAQTSSTVLDITDDGVPCSGAVAVGNCAAPTGGAAEIEGRNGPSANDGCDGNPTSAVGLFQDITPGAYPVYDAVVGATRYYATVRDTDWYRFQASTSDLFQAQVTSQFNGIVEFRQLSGTGTCSTNTLIVASPIGPRCGVASINSTVTAGNWYAVRVLAANTPTSSATTGGLTFSPFANVYKLETRVGGPPPNDDCANAATLVASQAGNTSSATNDGSSSCDPTGADVWYSYTVGANAGNLSLNTCASGTDTVISVFDACGGNELACNDDATGTPCSGPASALTVFLAANQTVKVRVSDKGAGVAFTLASSFVVPPPANDECVNATVLPSGSTVFSADTRFATPVGANSAPGSACQTNQSRDVWFAWMSQGAGPVTVDTCGATQPGSDSVITIYTGVCGTLTEIACDDDACVTPSLASTVTFAAACTTPYYIRVSQFSTSTITAPWTVTITAPGFVDSDGDGTDDCLDGCPNDPNKIAPGVCGCGVSDVDTDGDGTADCLDGCPNDPNKIAPGICGCGVSDVDTDGDGAADCIDGCPNDPNKIAPGVCGCGIPDTDTDGDGAADCIDGCPNDPNKVAPGVCGCGVLDTDTDGDGTPDCVDGCPNDPNKVAPGACGCGVADTDTDGDGIADCVDNCVTIANPGQEDCDMDGSGDACELFFGTATDVNANGIPDNCEGPVAYCTTGTSSSGCVPVISATGQPSVSLASPCVINVTATEGARSGVVFYGINNSGFTPSVWAPGSSSYLCVKAPTQRMGIQFSGGTIGACDGAFVEDWNVYQLTHPAALGNPFSVGQPVYVQCWYRDPTAPALTNLTGGLLLTTIP